MESEERILSYENIFSLEIDNYSSWKINRIEGNCLLYDKILLNKKGWFCHGGDDNHNHGDINNPLSSDSFGAFTMIKAEKLDYETITKALLDGHFYASQGPSIKALYVEDNKVTVECEPCAKIAFNTAERHRFTAYPEKDKPLTLATFEFDPADVYVRVTVIDEQGRHANTNAYFLDEIGKM
jgi:hypothetical protein